MTNLLRRVMQAVVVCIGLGSCLTSGDLAKIEESVAAHNAGEITTAELEAAIGEVAADVEGHTEGFLEGVSTGSPWIDLLVAGGALAAGAFATKKAAVVTVNRERDLARKLRGEKVRVDQ